MKEQKVERIYDNPNNDSRIPMAYVIVNNESLGGGGFGEVFKVQREIPGENPENKFFALKKIKKEGIVSDKDKHYRVLSEIKIHRALKNKYICKYEHSFEDDQSIYIVMEFCEKKSIDDYLKKRKVLTEYETRYYMFQVLRGLQYLRRKKIIHRDLTLANLFMKDYNTIKIGDFGLSLIETENEEKPGLMCGTQGYFTPEAVQTKYSYKTDIFCFGVCIYHMMTGLTLFKDAASSFESIKKGEINYDEKTKFSKQCKDLFANIFVFENKRIDLDEILVHPFFNEGKGLVDVDFPNFFDEKMNKKEFEEKIKNLEKKVIMTEVSTYPKKSDKKNNEYSSDSKDSDDLFKSKGSKDIISPRKKDNLFGKNVNFAQTLNEFNNNKEKNNNDSKNLNNINNNEKILQSGNNINNIDKNNNNINETNSSKEHPSKLENHTSDKKLSLMILDELSKKNKNDDGQIEITKPKIPPILNLAEANKESKSDEVEKEEKINQNNDLEKDNDKFNEKEIEHKEYNEYKDNILDETGSLGNKEHNQFIHEELYINNEEISSAQSNIYIKNILDEKNKTGISYQLSNGDIGIFFNDNTVMTKFSQYKNLIYYRKQIKNLFKILLPLKSMYDEDFLTKINYFWFIVEEAKKRKSRMKFINNKEENSKNDNNHEKFIDEYKKNKITQKDIFLLKYKKNYHAHFFLLSNNNIQIKYNDGIDVIFCCSTDKRIIYIDHKGDKSQFEIGPDKDFCEFICNDLKINKRIKNAIKDILK